ncbi:class A beta-lactamase [Actinoallomurus sp. CA-150999]|uniref:class A beta-lactamase n=1 Tax=Actinoallomurus sp. CA-150999 TaxID=3239887 RepID=UPI003D938BB0
MTNARQEDRSIRRRTGVAALAVLALVPLTACGTAGHATTASAKVSATATPAAERTDQAFQSLEKQHDARLGVWALDTGTGRVVSWRAGERFAYASTHKVLSSSNVLRQDSMKRLNTVVKYTSKDLVDYSPITEKNVDKGMTVRALCDAALRYSDNTAANLLFRELGGPSALQAALRRIGDVTTHVDRTEPTLNTAIPGDVRDTTTPQQMGLDLQKYTLGHLLPKPKRAMLIDWMRRNTTGGALIRAGVPSDWTIGDKTGSGDYGTRNDIAVAWPPHRAPIVITVFTTRSAKDAKTDDALVAAAAKVVAGRLS